MNIIKKQLHAHSPSVYNLMRDIYQLTGFVCSGSLARLIEESKQSQSDQDIYSLADKWLRPYQIKSEIMGLIEILRELQPKTFVEIGTANGGTHFLIRRMCTSIQKSVAIDTDIRNKFIIDRITATDKSNYISGKSCDPNSLKKFEKLVPDKTSVDLLFIDGDHSYAGVSQDFMTYRPYVRSGGYIVLHDIVRDWHEKYGRKTNKYAGGVPVFFEEIKEQYQHITFIEDADQDGFGIGVLIQP